MLQRRQSEPKMATWTVLVCVLLVNLTLAQNSKSLEDRFETLEREFAMEKTNMRSELQSARDDLDITRSQLRVTQSLLLETLTEVADGHPGKLNNTSTTNLETSESKTKPRTLSQILEMWMQKTANVLTKPCRHAQGDRDRTPPGPEVPITVPETKIQNQPISTLPLFGAIRRNRRDVDGLRKPAFHAELGIPAQNLNIHQTIIFDSPTLNTGLAYNGNTGIFTCAEAGTYYFSVSVMAFPHEKIETEMVKNGKQVLLTFSAGNVEFNQGTSSTALQLDVGDGVWVRILDTPSLSTGANRRLMGGGWTTFTGFKI